MFRKYLHKGPDGHSEPKAKNLAAAIFAAVMVFGSPGVANHAATECRARDPEHVLRSLPGDEGTRLALLAGS